MLSSRDETKKWSVDKDMFFSATKIKGDSASGVDTLLELQDNTGTDLWDWRNNGDVHMGESSTFHLGAKILKFDLGTTASPLKAGITLDASNINYTSGTSFPIFEAINNNGSILNLTSAGFLESRSDLNSRIAEFKNRSGLQGVDISSNQTQFAANEFKFRNSFGSPQYLIMQQGSGFSQLYMANTGDFEHWLRVGVAAQATFFKNGINGAGFNVGGSGKVNPLAKISLQDVTEITADLILKNNLKHLGYTSSAAAPTVTELPADKDHSIHKDTSAGTVYLAYNDGGTIKTTTLT
jgi:hypothetical protein